MIKEGGLDGKKVQALCDDDTPRGKDLPLLSEADCDFNSDKSRIRIYYLPCPYGIYWFVF
jgi:hypothetical protein